MIGLPESAEAWRQGQAGQALESSDDLQQLGTTRRIVQQLGDMERQGRKLHTLLLPTHLLERQASQDSQVWPEPVLLFEFACHVLSLHAAAVSCRQAGGCACAIPAHKGGVVSWAQCKLLASCCAGGWVRCLLGGCPASQHTARLHRRQAQQQQQSALPQEQLPMQSPPQGVQA